jgi:hypothetical protein
VNSSALWYSYRSSVLLIYGWRSVDEVVKLMAHWEKSLNQMGAQEDLVKRAESALGCGFQYFN